MVTRAFPDSNQLRTYNTELRETGTLLRGNILPAIGLAAAFSVLSGGVNDNTASGRAWTSAMYEMEVATYGVQEAITRALLPGIEAIAPHLADAVNALVDFNDETDNALVNLGLIAGGTAVAARSALVRRGVAAGAGAVAATGLGLGGTAITGVAGGAVAAGIAANQVQPFHPSQRTPGVGPFAQPERVPEPERSLPSEFAFPDANPQGPARPAPGGDYYDNRTLNVYGVTPDEILHQFRMWEEQGAVRGINGN